MASLATALSYQRLMRENATLGMLRGDNLAVVAAVLGARFKTPGTRISTEALHEDIDGDLEELRDHFPLGQGNAKSYCDAWRAAGILIRRPAAGTRGETYELSAEAYDAIRVLDQLESPHSTLTESRLMTLAGALHSLAIDTDPDQTRRKEALLAERERIDAQIAAIESGEDTILDDRAATERVLDILLQAQTLPADFARVRANFADLNHELRAGLIADDTQASVLDDIFRGVDLIESSDEGRTFTAFSALIRDPERSAAFSEDVSAILDRGFARDLGADTRGSLRTLLRDMKNGSRDIQATLTEFARALRRYVRSQDFQRDRALRGGLQRALSAAVPAATYVKPYADSGRDLELTGMRLSSVGAVLPHDPTEFDPGEPLTAAEPGTIDFAALARIARESEIDFAELAANVNESLEHAAGAASGSEESGKTVPADAELAGPVGAEAAPAPVVTVAQVLDRHPATQGVASVIGLLSLAAAQDPVALAGNVEDGDESLFELLSWEGTDGQERSARVPVLGFHERVFV